MAEEEAVKDVANIVTESAVEVQKVTEETLVVEEKEPAVELNVKHNYFILSYLYSSINIFIYYFISDHKCD